MIVSTITASVLWYARLKQIISTKEFEMAQILVSDIAVVGLAAHAATTSAHGLVDSLGQNLTPHEVVPDRMTSISVTAAGATTVSFHNDGDAVATANFRVWRYHTEIVPATLATRLLTGASIATTAVAGTMSAADKAKLDRSFGVHQDWTVASAPILLTCRTTFCAITGVGQTGTLADGTVAGQRKSIILSSVGTPGTDTMIITATGGPWTLIQPNDSLELEWNGAAWVITNDNRQATIDVHYGNIDMSIFGAHQDWTIASPPIDLTHRTTYCAVDAVGEVATLANSTITGQRKSIVLTTIGHAGDSVVVTPTSGGPWTLDHLNDALEIEWNGTAWALVSQAAHNYTNVHYSNLDDSIFGAHQDWLVAAPAVSLTVRTTYMTADNVGDVATVANSTTLGQRKSLILTTIGHAGDTVVVTPIAGGPWTLDHVNDSIEIEWDGAAWVLVNDNRQVTINAHYANLDMSIYGDHQDLAAGGGAVDLTHRTTYLTTAAAAASSALANSTVTGQRKSIILTTVTTPGTDTAVITATGGPWTLYIASASLELEWNGAAWVLVNDNRLPLTVNCLMGTQVAVVADDQVLGGIPVFHVIDVPDGASADHDVTITHKTEVLDVMCIKTGANGAAANTVTVQNAANAITDAMSININLGVVAKNLSIDTAQSVINGGGTLRAAMVKVGGNSAARVIVRGIRRA